ncbi:MAG TPA: hypothetical protein VMM56_16235, partial [Planctomycetaceae bacterium]|nr:hypothetical protein [Planctomycetaceae bacterium]
TFPVPIVGNQQYAAWYESQGPRDEQGRSLRQFDLETRLFKYCCSPLVVSPIFASLPEELRRRIAGRIEHVLSGQSPEANTIPIEQRTETLELLRKLSPDF